jgi:hypothetical protein
MDIVNRLTDLSRLGQAPLIIAAISGVGAFVYSDQVIAYISNNKAVYTLVYVLAGLGLGTLLFSQGVRVA